FWRAHQVPVDAARQDEGHRRILEEWMRSYRLDELFGSDGRLLPELRALAPEGDKRMGASPYANGGLRQALKRPDWRDFAMQLPSLRSAIDQATRAGGRDLAQVLRLNDETRNFQGMCTD